MRDILTCKDCGWQWLKRLPINIDPKQCSRCQSKTWKVGKQTQLVNLQEMEILDTLDYEEVTNQGGQEWHTCMYFNDKTDEVMESCIRSGFNVATIEVPLSTVDVTWRGITRPAAHPSERGCYMTMPLVLCLEHIQQLMREINTVETGYTVCLTNAERYDRLSKAERYGRLYNDSRQ